MINYTVLQSLEEQMEKFTLAQRKVADYIIKHPAESAFLTIEQLAAITKVSVATIMRLTYALRYTGYMQFQKDLQELLRSQIVPARSTEPVLHEADKHPLVVECAAMQIENINKTVEFLTNEAITKGFGLIERAKKIFVIGVRASFPMAQYLSDGFLRLGLECELLMPEAVRTQSVVARFGPEDLVIAISLPRYSKRTLELCQVAKEKGAKVLAITDGYSSPVAILADAFLPCSIDTLAFQSSPLAVMFLVEVLITHVGIRYAREAQEHLSETEKIMPALDANVLK